MTNIKRIAVFGANGGIGSAVVRMLANQGHTVSGIVREHSTPPSFFQGEIIPLTASTWDGFAAAAQNASLQMGGLDGVVNCIGSLLLKPIHLTREAEFDDQIHLHLKSTAAILATTIPLLRQSKCKDRSVVMLSSVAASRGLANHEVISAVKGGIEGMMRSAAATYARQGIRFNAVAPGLTRTPMTERIWNNEATCKQAEKNHPLGRLGEADEIADAIGWLLSDASAWVTGNTLHVDGGMAQIQNLNA